jgi:prephenate dehydratase
MNHPTFAISAVAGSFTEEAARHYLKDQNIDAELVFVGTPTDAFRQVCTGKLDMGIIPIENSNAGFVLTTLYAAADFTYKILDVVTIPVRQNLLVLPSTEAKDVVQITSQLPALEQCSDYLDQMWRHAVRTEYVDTALAARDLAAGKLDPTTAVVASRTAAKLYDLKILAADIQTDHDNRTKFMVFTKHD